MSVKPEAPVAAALDKPTERGLLTSSRCTVVLALDPPVDRRRFLNPAAPPRAWRVFFLSPVGRDGRFLAAVCSTGVEIVDVGSKAVVRPRLGIVRSTILWFAVVYVVVILIGNVAVTLAADMKRSHSCVCFFLTFM